MAAGTVGINAIIDSDHAKLAAHPCKGCQFSDICSQHGIECVLYKRYETTGKIFNHLPKIKVRGAMYATTSSNEDKKKI